MKEKGTQKMKKWIIILLTLIVVLSLVSCGKKWECADCGKTFTGKAYYDLSTNYVLCEECARRYWMPLDYRNYQIK